MRRRLKVGDVVVTCFGSRLIVKKCWPGQSWQVGKYCYTRRSLRLVERDGAPIGDEV